MTTTEPDPFMIRAHVPHWEASVADYRAASAATRTAIPSRLGIAYGDQPSEALDLFFPAPGAAAAAAPVHLFIHGGYWRSFAKEDYSFVADGVTAAGAIAAILDYSLMPAARMDVLVSQARRAAHWLHDHAAAFGGDPGAISASGHSAGAHLASFLVCRGPHEPAVVLPEVRSVLLASGIYDLAPIARSFLQPELRLTNAEILRWSPLAARPAPGANVSVVVGADETAPFHAQAAAFAGHLDRAGVPHRVATIQGEDHMTIVRALGRPGTAAWDELARTVAASGR